MRYRGIKITGTRNSEVDKYGLIIRSVTTKIDNGLTKKVKYGVVDSIGKIIVPIECQDISELDADKLHVQLDNTCYVFNKKTREMIEL